MLTRFQTYSRKDVHDIFDPSSKFTQSAGSWGLHGIVKIPNTDDFVFFVTYGQSQAGHTFDEGITHEGVLTWQSQPRQSLVDKTILKFFEHNHNRNNIHLFLRTSKKVAYTYFGRLKYLEHDNEREKPVHFQWQIIDWETQPEVFRQIELKLDYSSNDITIPKHIKDGLIETDLVKQRVDKKKGIPTKKFKNLKAPDYSEKDAKNRKLGFACEKLVIKYEENKLKELGLPELVKSIQHISKDVGDFMGYDIQSFDENGNRIFIEVKGTKGPETTRFFISKNEVEFSKANAKDYYIYRVYEFDFETNSGKFFKVKGDVSDNFILTPDNYIVSI